MKAITQAELYKRLSAMIKSTEQSEREAVAELLHELSPVGYVPLVKACAKYRKLKAYPDTPVRIQLAMSRVCGRSDRSLTEVKERFEALEYPHLLDQLRALLTDLELYIMPDVETCEGLRWRLWFDVCRALLKELGSEERSRLALILAELSDELGRLVEVDMARLVSDGPKIMARHLKTLERGGDVKLSVITGVEAEELSERDQVTLITSSGAERYDGRADLAELMKGREGDVRAGFTMIYCPAGKFWMGNRRVKINKPFLMGQTQVTQALWEEVMSDNPSDFKGKLHPVEKVSWYGMVKLCNALSALENFKPVYSIGSGDTPDITLDFSANGYCMPTEAEWEYAAKAGIEFVYAGSAELEQVGWFEENSHYKTHSIAQKKANAWGLHDMSGNVWEWCNDQGYISSSARCVSRGGSWFSSAGSCRVTGRRRFSVGFRGNFLGGRLLRRNLDS